MANNVLVSENGREAPVAQAAVAPWAANTMPVVLAPPMDILQTDDELVVFMDLPGAKVEEIDVSVANGELVLRGSFAQRPSEGIGPGPVRQYRRAVQLPKGIGSDRIKVRYHSGVLEAHLIKPQDIRVKRVQVNT